MLAHLSKPLYCVSFGPNAQTPEICCITYSDHYVMLIPAKLPPNDVNKRSYIFNTTCKTHCSSRICDGACSLSYSHQQLQFAWPNDNKTQVKNDLQT